MKTLSGKYQIFFVTREVSIGTSTRLCIFEIGHSQLGSIAAASFKGACYRKNNREATITLTINQGHSELKKIKSLLICPEKKLTYSQSSI